jgi:hypothetical protein
LADLLLIPPILSLRKWTLLIELLTSILECIFITEYIFLSLISPDHFVAVNKD